MLENIYYVYSWNRVDGSPYYIGKGKGNRAFNKKRMFVPKDKKRIVIIKDNLTESEAFALEVSLIEKFGREDLGLGTLKNKTNGGDGHSGFIKTEKTKKQVSEKLKGVSKSDKHRENISKGRLGITFSEEHRRKLCVANSKRRATADTRMKTSESMKNIPQCSCLVCHKVLKANNLFRHLIGKTCK